MCDSERSLSERRDIKKKRTQEQKFRSDRSLSIQQSVHSGLPSDMEQAGGVCQHNNTLSLSQQQAVRHDLKLALELESGEVSKGNLPEKSAKAVA